MSQTRVGPFPTPVGGRATVALRDDSTTVAVDDHRSVSFDAAGRLIRASWGARSVRRSLDNRFVEKRKTGDYAWSYVRRELDRGESTALLQEIAGAVAAVREGLAQVPGPAAPLAAAGARLEGTSPWTAERLAAEAARFAAAYRPVPILPPDQYRALVIQVTEGCSYNRCAHCRFYRDRPFHAKGSAELTAHVRAVRDFFGDGLSLRRSIFLGDANALVLPPAWLRDAFDCLDADLGPHVQGYGVTSFIDAFSGAPRSTEHFGALARRGLRRVYLGVETGCDALLAFLEKPSTTAEVRRLVEQLKAGGLSVGVIVMLGIGGVEYGARHVAETQALLAALPLGAGDILYLSPLVASDDSPYREKERAAGIRTVDDVEMDRQYQALRVAGPAGLRAALYDIRDFLY